MSFWSSCVFSVYVIDIFRSERFTGLSEIFDTFTLYSLLRSDERLWVEFFGRYKLEPCTVTPVGRVLYEMSTLWYSGFSDVRFRVIISVDFAGTEKVLKSIGFWSRFLYVPAYCVSSP